MTISLSDNTPRVSYNVAQGVTQTSFTVNFEFFDDADLNFYVDGTLKTLTTHYTVTGGDGSTGTITTTEGNSVTGITGGSTVVITRDIALARTTDFPSAGAFEVAKLNTELDRFTAIAADINDDTDRSIHLADDDEAVSTQLPLKADRLGKVLGFNATTGAVEAGPTIADVSSLAQITADISTLADIEDGTDSTDAIQTVSGISSNVTTVAGISANVTTVAGISSNVTTVANDATDIGTVATNIASVNTVATNIADVVTVANDLNEAISEIETAANDLNEATSEIDTVANAISNVDTVGTNIANVNTVAGISSNVTTVAGNDTNITTVAGISSNVTTVAGISSDVTAVAGDATDIGTVATNISNVNAVGAIDSDVTTVAGISANVTSVAGISSNVTTVAGDSTNIGTVATDLSGSDNIGTVAGSISNVNSVGGSITNVNTVASNLSSVNSFANTYRIGATDPTTSLDTGDLFYNTTSSALKVYTGSAWEQGVTAGSGFLATTGGALTGNLTFGDANEIRMGASNDLVIQHDGSRSIIQDNGTGNLRIQANNLELNNADNSENYIFAQQNGAVSLYYDNSVKLETTSTGVSVTGTASATTFSGDLNGTINTNTTATTQSAGNNTTKVATTAFVTTAVNNAEPFPSGTSMLFQQTSAPTGWTKQTTHNDKALRIVTGTVGTGGSSAFSTALATPSVAGGAVSGAPGNNQTVSAGNLAVGSGNLSVSMSGNISSTTLSINQIPSHTHQYRQPNNPVQRNALGTGANNTANYVQGVSNNANTGSRGGNGSHNHGHNLSGSMSGSPSLSGNPTLSGNLTAGNLAVGSSTASINVSYVDFIIANKD